MKKTIAVVLVVGIASGALAHTGATGIVKERMDGMGALADAMKALVTMNKSGDLDVDKIKEISATIQNHSGETLIKQFPEGSLPDVSEASPEIWQDMDGFSKISNQLYDAALALEAGAASRDLALGDMIQTIGATCGACHKKYRIKK